EAIRWSVDRLADANDPVTQALEASGQLDRLVTDVVPKGVEVYGGMLLARNPDNPDAVVDSIASLFDPLDTVGTQTAGGKSLLEAVTGSLGAARPAFRGGHGALKQLQAEARLWNAGKTAHFIQAVTGLASVAGFVNAADDFAREEYRSAIQWCAQGSGDGLSALAHITKGAGLQAKLASQGGELALKVSKFAFKAAPVFAVIADSIGTVSGWEDYAADPTRGNLISAIGSSASALGNAMIMAGVVGEGTVVGAPAATSLIAAGAITDGLGMLAGFAGGAMHEQEVQERRDLEQVSLLTRIGFDCSSADALAYHTLDAMTGNVRDPYYVPRPLPPRDPSLPPPPPIGPTTPIATTATLDYPVPEDPTPVDPPTSESPFARPVLQYTGTLETTLVY
ncbi:MAG: hypothetical protein AB1758_33545, partial [Candidatus Eremiobacterota bacterium]